jgi:acyl-CoA thioesterase YciA
MSNDISNIDETPKPVGKLMLQAVTMPRDTNASGDIFGGWLLSQMDMAGGVAASYVAGGRTATVAIEQMSFLVPVEVGTIVSCYAEISEIGNTSVKVLVEAWKTSTKGIQKVTDGTFVYVAINQKGKTRPVKEK